MNRAQIAAMVDHTLLTPEATAEQVRNTAAWAAEFGCASVCVSPNQLPIAAPGVNVCTVIGFPSGAHTTPVKVMEADLAIGRGADEVDMVINLSWAKDQRFHDIEVEIAAVREVVPTPRILKVIIESAALTDEEIVACCQAAQRAGADLVKTSTGYHKAGGATPEAVRLMRQTVGSTMGVKASGGIRTKQAVERMIEAGANRLGLSATAQILAAFDEGPANLSASGKPEFKPLSY